MTLEENESKLCSKCHKNHRQGFQYWCKQCISEYNRQYRETHREEMRERVRVWKRKLKGKALERYKTARAISVQKWREKNPDKYREITRRTSAKYRATHAEKLREIRDAYRRAHKPEINAYAYKRYHEDPEYRAMRLRLSREYREKHREEINRRRREKSAKKRADAERSK